MILEFGYWDFFRFRWRRIDFRLDGGIFENVRVVFNFRFEGYIYKFVFDGYRYFFY